MISGLGRIESGRAPPVRVQGGFAPASGAGPVLSPAAAPGVAGLLSMQEAGLDTVRDREARRHGRAMLKALSELQRALLGGDDADLDRLATLVRTATPPDDPALAGVQRAMLVRAAVELARSGRVGQTTGRKPP